MPSNPKIFINNVPVEICTSVQKGLPLIATEYMKIIIEGVLAAAQEKYPLFICHYIVLGNHIHIIVVVKDPEDVSAFMEYFKTESAHAINRLKGTTGESFWKEGFDSPMIISAEKVLDRMVYLYMNSVEAGVAESVATYKGLSTYSSLFQEKQIKQCKKISRSEFEELPDDHISEKFQKEFVQTLKKSKGRSVKLVIEPWAWLQCFSASRNWSISEVRERFFKRLREVEARRLVEKKQEAINQGKEYSIDLPKIPNLNIHASYRSKRNGKKMICLSDCAQQRNYMISKFKQLRKLAREAYQKRKLGDYRALPPPGFFLPGGALLINLVFPQIIFGILT